ncbi:hypothetical protein GW932_04255, partial [archaeon]|nr:hypothetical protein [archaeon]
MKRLDKILLFSIIFVIFFSLIFFRLNLTGKVVDTNYIDSTDTIGSDIISVLINLYNLPTLDKFIFNWEGREYPIYDESLILMMNFEDNVLDVSRYGHNGTIVSGVSYLDSKYGKGLNF